MTRFLMRSASTRRTGSVSATAFLRLVALALPLVACDEQVKVPERRPPAAPAPAVALYDLAAQAALDGPVAKALQAGDTPQTRTLIQLDFEDQSTGSLQAVSEDANTTRKAKGLSKVADDSTGSNKALKLDGGMMAGMSWRTPPIPVSAATTYTLTYSVKTDGLEGPEGARFRLAAAEALFYSIPSYNHDPAAAVSTMEKRKRNSVATPAPARGPNKKGTTAWETHTLTFKAPKQATYMVLSFDHSRNAEDRGTGKQSKGTVWFDNIILTTTDSPLHVQYRNPDDLNPTPHPLQLRVELPAEDRGAETRYALYAPAGSTLSFKQKIPEAARLSLAAGVLREGWIAGSGTVGFEVQVIDASGQKKSVWQKSLDPGKKDKDRYWQPAVIDLSAFSGQEVQLALVTTVKGGIEGSFPGAAAVWGDPQLFSAHSQGRLIVLTVLDTVSVGHVSAYGYRRDTTRSLDRIGKKGVVFEHAYSAAPWTLPSFASLFTGVDAVRHGAGERAWGEVVWRRPLPERFVTLAESLRSKGFQTVAFMNNPYLTSTFGVGQGFTTYRDYGVGTKSGAGEIGVDRALEWLTTHRGYDRFLVVHLMDAHGPYRPPKGYATRYSPWFSSGRFVGEMGAQDYLDLAEQKKPAKDENERQQVMDLYDGALAFADYQTGRLYDAVLKEAGTQDVTFIVTSDHGEELWEHQSYEHGHQAYNEMLKVPLIVENPAYFQGGKRISEPVRLTDVMPTVLELMGAPPAQGVDGASLMSLLSGGKPAWPTPRDIFAENELYGSAQNALIRMPWKYMYNMANTSRPERRPKSTHRYELYQLEQDPQEQKNLTTQEGGTLAELHEKLDRHLRPMMAGRYVLALDGGGVERQFAATLQLPQGASWFAHYEDLIAPLADGSEGKLQVSMRANQLQFAVKTSRALLSFKPQNLPEEEASRGLTLAFTIDGELWRDGIAVPTGEKLGAGLEAVRFSDAQLSLPPEQLPDPVRNAVSLFVGKTTERALGLSQKKDLPPETEERLRALGYIQ